MDNLTQQIDEIEALSAIYGDEWQVENEENRSYSINIGNGKKYVKLYVKLPNDYPSSAPPSFELSAPYLSLNEKQHISSLLQEVYLSCVGQIVLYQWIEKIREILDSEDLPNLKNTQENIINNQNVPMKVVSDCRPMNDKTVNKCPEIYHGEVIVDRKSCFQGHVAKVTSIEDVKLILKTLLEEKKIMQATHNMYAYRIYQEKTKSFLHDCDDDGENQAGGRLLHLLEIIDVKNVIVIVSRWYGGIHLGSDRFRHINNAARQVLEAANLISKHKDNKK
ncbi:hypothetical protein PV325_003189 [Microctonus aethiopoides]|uniref:RWD domain-containing protein n=1 Tax=Microctonus aethiopoides TaxID=144406 RepID=A0AA39FQX2_9HYME|nr:hypothetical protein PV325_003189 [Microctonus aethiopoides]KAK0093876.1 hypothetical protein PV326_012418 [Microctonus aethiopoides]KAK0174048.1 hypothetical protein PV328_007165 [Microctonus aethiopoides]